MAHLGLPSSSIHTGFITSCFSTLYCSHSLIMSQRSTPITRAAGVPRCTVCGGVQLLVDMSRAFDTIDRNKLFGRLHSLGVRPAVAKLLQCWHQDSCYIVHSDSRSSEIPVTKGVRQGCKAAPWLWNAILTMILEDLSSDR